MRASLLRPIVRSAGPAFKTAVFAFFISSIASFYGYYARGGSLGVGKSGTRAIVISSVMVLLFDLILTKLML